MKHRALLLALGLALAALAVPAPALADGIIIPDPPPCDPCPPPPCPEPGLCPSPSPMARLVIRYHRVAVSIEDQVAITRVDQAFYNPNDWPVEGSYVFPLPAEAALSDFSLWVDGQAVPGEILDAGQARRRYEEIVSQMQDPALLEYADRGAWQARIFPIPPRGERRIQLEYAQALPAENGLVRYLYPLDTEKFSALPLEEVSVHVEVRSSLPIRAIYSPSHPIAVSREDDFIARAGYEESQALPDRDFALYYSVGESQAFHLLTYRDPGDGADPDGFFLLLLAPRPSQPAAAVEKDLLLVLDRSGSMDGEKFLQAQEALRYVLRRLNPGDRFNVVTFSTGVERFADELQPASEAAGAIAWVDGLRAEGSTDINRALLEAVSTIRGERPAYLVFLTDGLPTEGVTESRQILENLARSAPENLSLFAFGVGYDVDTFLLDSLAQAHHGSSSYVLPDERLDESLSAFFARISAPVLTGLSLDFDDISAYELYPHPLPDLFLGSQIVVVGRYRQGGKAAITLHGQVNGEPQSFAYPDQVFAEDSRGESAALSALPRLWATRKIGALLNRIRLLGPDEETIDQIVRLSIRYGIVTPYTSFLVTEESPLGEGGQERIAAEALNSLQMAAPEPPSGQAAVQKAMDQGELAEAEIAAEPVDDSGRPVRIVGARTFILEEGVWIDTAFDPEKMPPVPVTFLSRDYFALASARRELAAAFALGPQVIAVSDGRAYRVLPAGTPSAPLQTPVAIATETPQPGLEATPTPQALAFPTPTPAAGAPPCAAGLLAPLPALVFAALRRRTRTAL